MNPLTDTPIASFVSQEAFRSWINDHYTEPKGIWMRIYKKDSGVTSITYQEALEVALCYGWIDGQKLSFDETSWLQKYTPRRPRSGWSKINREKVAHLIKVGLMQPPGLAEVEKARTDGRLNAAYDPQSTATIPEDFQAALTTAPAAQAFFATLSKTNRYAILYRIQTAKKPETREKRIRLFIEMLVKGETLHP